MPMADTTFTWAVANLERETADGYIFTVHWTITAKDAAYSASAYGSIGLDRPEADEMVPYADVTEQLVVQWLLDKLGAEKIAEIEGALQTQLDEMHAPSKANGLPWGN